MKTVGGTTVAAYTYDENSRRVYSKVGTKETYFRYDGTSNHVLFEEDASGAITKAYTYDSNGHPLTLTYNNQTYYYLTNYRGDVLALTNASGTVVAEYTYDAWGNILTQSGSMATINPYRYAGYRYDEETKLYYLMARYYNPDTGVFLSLDPVRGDVTNPLTINGYNYANNNPVMMVDPNGENPAVAIYGLIFMFAKPLLKKYGSAALKKYGPTIKNYAVKLFKGLDRYRVTSSTNAPVVILDTKNGYNRVFSLDYHANIPLKNKRNGKTITTEKVWHYHLKDVKNQNIHYVFSWSIPSGYSLITNNSFRLVW